MNAKTAIIGHTGFVGSNLIHQAHFDDLYNSKNINSIKGRVYDLVVCAGTPAEKWKANNDPIHDWQNIQILIDSLSGTKIGRLILISTVDVYITPYQVYEDTFTPKEGLHAYGLHRLLLEEFVRQQFQISHIIRLPALFGPGLKKNFIFDLIHKPDALHLTHCRSHFQFYNIQNLWRDIRTVLENKLCLINFATPPLEARNIAWQCLSFDYSNKTNTAPIFYDMRTRYARIFSQNSGYICSAESEMESLRAYLKAEKVYSK